MIGIDGFRELYDYNYWARDRQLEACAALTEEQFLLPMGNSFSSVRNTLAHLIYAEWVWLERWLGRTPTTAGKQEHAGENFPTLASIRDRWSAVERNMRSYLTRLDDAALARAFSYINWEGRQCTYPLWATMFHVANHQTYHRGQITTLLRQLGAKAPEIDYLVMQDEGSTGHAAGARS